MARSGPICTLAAALILTLAACAAPPRVEPKPPQVGEVLTIEATDWRTGQPVELAQLRGKVTLIELWATWCGPCAQALAHHSQLYQRLQSKGLRALAISLDEDRDALVRFLASREIPFAIAWDSQQRTGERLRPPLLPTTYVLDVEGKILGIYRGGDDAALRAIRDQVESALEKP